VEQLSLAITKIEMFSVVGEGTRTWWIGSRLLRRKCI